MLPSQSPKFMHALTVLFLILEVGSQSIRFEVDGQRNRSSSPSPSLCDANSSCIRIRQCGPFRILSNWREVGITCGQGGGWFRRVCCPDRNGLIRGASFVRSSLYITPPPLRLQESSRPINLNNFNQGECGQSRYVPPRKIMSVGGKDANEGVWPWMAAIRIRERSGTYTPWCTGFLIDKRHVISAAHCFGNPDPGSYITRIGHVNQDEADTYEVNRIAKHEGYREGQFYNDIAILTLTKDVNFTGFNPICLPDEIVANKNLEGHGTAVAGWGTTTPGGSISIVLNEIRQVPVVSNSDCNNILRRMRDSRSFRRRFPQGINEGFICAGFVKGEKDPCGGDSGAPLMLQIRNTWFAVGVVSFGYSCGLPGIPGGYTRISEYMEWIWQNTRN